jgi:hypothetical protein
MRDFHTINTAGLSVPCKAEQSGDVEDDVHGAIFFQRGQFDR